MTHYDAYTVRQFCESHGIGRTTFYNEVSSGRLRTRKIGRRTVVLAGDAASWRESLPAGGRDGDGAQAG
jgi:hypothetical protein